MMSCFALSVISRLRDLSARRSLSEDTMMSIMPPRFSRVSGWNMMISSRRLRNSGRNDIFSSCITALCASSLMLPSAAMPSSRC